MEKEIAKQLKEIYKEIYGEKVMYSNIFEGGNVGAIINGLHISKGLKSVANAIDRLTAEIKEQQ